MGIRGFTSVGEGLSVADISQFLLHRRLEELLSDAFLSEHLLHLGGVNDIVDTWSIEGIGVHHLIDELF